MIPTGLRPSPSSTPSDSVGSQPRPSPRVPRRGREIGDHFRVAHVDADHAVAVMLQPGVSRRTNAARGAGHADGCHERAHHTRLAPYGSRPAPRHRVQARQPTARRPRAQVAVARDGAVLLRDVRRRGERDPVLVFSATKPVVASAIWVLIGEGFSTSSRPVADSCRSSGPTARSDHRRASAAAHRRVPGRAHGRVGVGRPRAPAQRFTELAAATGSRGRASSTTRRRRIGCSPS